MIEETTSTHPEHTTETSARPEEDAAEFDSGIDTFFTMTPDQMSGVTSGTVPEENTEPLPANSQPSGEGTENCLDHLTGVTLGYDQDYEVTTEAVVEVTMEPEYPMTSQPTGQSTEEGEGITSDCTLDPEQVSVAPSEVSESGDLCPADGFKCGSGMCLPKLFVCDGDKDCPDGSDETNCATNSTQQPLFDVTENSMDLETGVTVEPGQISETTTESVVEVTTDPEKSTEYDGHVTTEAKLSGVTCPANGFQCDNGMCLPKLFVCDGDEDCPDGSDETNCATNSTEKPIFEVTENSRDFDTGVTEEPDQVSEFNAEPVMEVTTTPQPMEQSTEYVRQATTKTYEEEPVNLTGNLK